LGFNELAKAYDGKEAIDLLRSKSDFKAVITDYNMPYNTGADVIKEALNLGVPKIILRSSHSVSTLIGKLKENNIDSSLVKIICKRDYDSSSLREYLKSHLIELLET
jgi:CheY-like chemotaxis protein